MITLQKCTSIDKLSEKNATPFISVKDDGFYVKRLKNLIAFPFEDPGYYSKKEIDMILFSTESTDERILGGIFDEEFDVFVEFFGTLDSETLVFLNENYPNSRIYFHNKNLDYIFFLSGIEYSVLFAAKNLGEKYFEKSLEDVISDFYKFTLNWPEHWNMGFLNTILENTKIYNNEVENTFVNFLPVKVIKLS